MAKIEQITQFIGEEKTGKIEKLQFENDVLINGFPRTGTTWLQEMVWIIQHDGDLATASKSQVGCRVPFLESHGFDWEHNIEDLDKHPHPRVIKSHFPPSTFHSQLDKVKIIVPIRNPKDTVVSQHYYFKMAKFIPFELPFENVFGAFVDDATYGVLNVFGNYFPWYMQLEKVLDHKNILLVKYEDLKKDLRGGIRRIATFLDKKFDEETISAIAEHCSFDRIKQNAMVNQTERDIYDSSKSNFCRKGQVGNWKELLTDDQSKYMDKMYKNTLHKIGITLEFD